jgi:hypothetical protein
MSFSIISSECFRLRSRSYVIAAIAIAFAGLFAVMAANVLVDPQGVFGTGLFVPVANPNLRYLDLKAYKTTPDRYDGVLFASSRGEAFDTDLLAQRLGVRAVANFSVPDGLMTDHLPELEYLLRDKAERGANVTAIFLLLDADLFGTRPWTDDNIDSFLPPEVGDESRWRFWWRYLTVFQFTNWRRYISRALATSRSGAHQPRTFAPLEATADQLAGAVNSSEQNAAGPPIRPDLAHQIGLLRRFVALCRENKIKLVVAFSPLNARNEYAGDAQMQDNERIVAIVADIIPVWDFDRPAWLSQRPDLWNDVFHYKSVVANMMLQRIFGGETTAPPDFGQLKGPAAPALRDSPGRGAFAGGKSVGR